MPLNHPPKTFERGQYLSGARSRFDHFPPHNNFLRKPLLDYFPPGKETREVFNVHGIQAPSVPKTIPTLFMDVPTHGLRLVREKRAGRSGTSCDRPFRF